MARSSLLFLIASTAALVLAQAPPPSTLQPVGTPTSAAIQPTGTAAPRAPATPVAGPQQGPPPSAVSAAGAGSAPSATAAAGPAQGGAPPGGQQSHSPFAYQPSFSVAVGGAIVFIISAAFHGVQLFTYKSWYFALLFQAVLIDVAAAIARCNAVLNSQSIGAGFIVQMMLFQIAPSLLGIVHFFTMTRVVWWVTPNEKRTRQVLGLPIHKISFCWTLMFAVPDMVKAVASNVAKPPENKPPNPGALGNRIQQVCLAVQFFVVLLWTLWSYRFMRMSRKWIVNGDAEDKDWRRLGWALVFGGVLITWRILYASIEFDAMYNPKAFVTIHEWTFWVFNALPILLMYTNFNLNHPGEFLPRDYTRFKFNTKAIEKTKMETAWPLTISNPIPRADDKDIEVITTEVHPHPGSRV